ncbi:MAG: aminotransferase class I/II-fold pyridoxal phosphate-dependent enzyme [Alphaproteobacteria bacterium]|nr:aminotransferase class I/II-fold pyridoxal phosphate-dependent enzyme [Alphaproteobacteria bacterium]
MSDKRVQFLSDGVALSAAEYADLLARLAEADGIAMDEFSRDGVVAQLEQRMAALLGKETAVFLPSGTLANNLALRLLAQRGRRVLVQRESHIFNDSGDCAQELSGLSLIPLAPGEATFTLDQVTAEIERAETGRVLTPVGVISIESPVRRVAGEVFDFSEMKRIAEFARERRIGLHLDGARVFLASAYTGIAPETYAALFDTVYVSLYKYFNAAGGAVLAGPRQLLANLYHQRRMFGGSLRQAWPYAAVALHYLDGFTERFERAAAVSSALFAALGERGRCEIVRSAAATNVTRLRVRGSSATMLPKRLLAGGVAIRTALRSSAAGAEFELVTNETILRRPIAETIEIFAEALAFG